jgi:alkylation response protein AidB-like acyl-CoA dehydrogenase
LQDLRGETVDFSIPKEVSDDLGRFQTFLNAQVVPNLSDWYNKGAVTRDFHLAMGQGGWYGFDYAEGRLTRTDSLKRALVAERLAALSPGIAVAALAHADLGLAGLWLFGSEALQQRYGDASVLGENLICLGNTESGAGSDVANIRMTAERVSDGWALNGTKAYVTNGWISDLAVITAISDPDAQRNNRLSMFLVDLTSEGVRKKKLSKQVWMPSDLTRIQLKGVVVPEDHLIGERGHGLQQVLTVFTHSRVPISALALGTAMGAYELGLAHARKRRIFDQRIVDQQAKAFEIADFYARIEAARLAMFKACWVMDRGEDFRLESSLTKYLSVMIAREVSSWAADLFGAASVMLEHPIHKFPMDAWGASLGEGTQDVQKLIIFREVIKRSQLFPFAT